MSGRSACAGKERKDPSVTPRKFRKFFAPRNTDSARIRPTRKAFQDVTRPFLCRKDVKSSPVHPSKYYSLHNSDPCENLMPQTKRRKRYHTPDPPSELTIDGSDSLESYQDDAQNDIVWSSPCERAARLSDTEIEYDHILSKNLLSKRILPISCRGLPGQLLERSFGTFSRNGKLSHSKPVNGL